MRSVEEALSLILSHVQTGPPETVAILESIDRVLAEDICSEADLPPFDGSTMDGYAVRSTDTAGATPARPRALTVVGELAAGHPCPASVTAGAAIRVMTGAPLPPGADGVVRLEDTNECGTGRKTIVGEMVDVHTQVSSGENVRPAGEDIKEGAQVLSRGQSIRPQEIGILASLGRGRIRVVRRPRVGILATGDELVGIDEALAPGKIRNSNEYSNAALVKRYGGIPIMLGIARDTAGELSARIREGVECGIDLLVTSGGVSVGDYDMVKQVLASEGNVSFWQVRMKPGKPLAFGQVHGVPLIGLPGNPVAAMVSFEQFARPCILKMLGRTRLEKPAIQAILDEQVRLSALRSYKRVVVERRDGHYHASLAGPRGSSNLTSMVRANGLAVLPEGVGSSAAGQLVDVQMLDWPEEMLV